MGIARLEKYWFYFLNGFSIEIEDVVDIVMYDHNRTLYRSLNGAETVITDNQVLCYRSQKTGEADVPA